MSSQSFSLPPKKNIYIQRSFCFLREGVKKTRVFNGQALFLYCFFSSMKMILSQPVGSSSGLDMEQILKSYQCRLQKSWFMFQTPEKYIYQNNLYEDKFLRGVMNILALSNCKTGTCRRCHCLFIVYANK